MEGAGADRQPPLSAVRAPGELVAPTRVWISRSALRDILDATRDKWPLETGGMLLGYHGEDRPEVVITNVTGPGPNARHRRDTFSPDGRWQQRRLAELYESSGHVTAFVGDWHSHADEQPLPSPRDLKTARKVSRRRNARTPHPSTLIVGTDEEALAMSAFVLVEGILRWVPWETFDA